LSFTASSLENIFKVSFSYKPQIYLIWGLCSVKFMSDLEASLFVVPLAVWRLWLWEPRLKICGVLAVCGGTYCLSAEAACQREKGTLCSGTESSLLLCLLWCVWVVCCKMYSVSDSSLQMEVTWSIVMRLGSLTAHSSDSEEFSGVKKK